ncbi:hypothetical protein UFOVP20_42 [uncultured Caudovirales phage]|uniref:Uncharacterized protein n=1 Tax=uncultured Caudovirales phage TaxID=2100421 RepID=A0A6J5KIP8_9CAUD|nr:hypothetical protein UFOVP20_42 [uncultured Caudovirales phage]
MAYSVTPLAGIDLTSTVTTNTNSANVAVPTIGPLGLEVFGSDGKLYVLAKANASIPASTAVCTVDPATFLVTATGGAYTSPAVALTSGQYAWFSKASV